MSSIFLKGEVASKSTIQSNFLWKYFSDNLKACFIAGSFAEESDASFLGLKNQQCAPYFLATPAMALESVETTTALNIPDFLA